MLLFTACWKSDGLSNCTERVIQPASAHSIDPADVAVLNDLFRKSGIDYSHFRYIHYRHDTMQRQYAPFERYDNKYAWVGQHVNGLPVFTGDIIFDFVNDKLNYQSGIYTKGTSLNNDPKLNAPEIRKLFLKYLAQFNGVYDSFKDSCFKCEFGYYNLNAGIGNADEQLVKAWRITPKNNDLPMAVFKDADGRLVIFDTGLRTFSPD